MTLANSPPRSLTRSARPRPSAVPRLESWPWSDCVARGEDDRETCGGRGSTVLWMKLREGCGCERRRKYKMYADVVDRRDF